MVFGIVFTFSSSWLSVSPHLAKCWSRWFCRAWILRSSSPDGLASSVDSSWVFSLESDLSGCGAFESLVGKADYLFWAFEACSGRSSSSEAVYGGGWDVVFPRSPFLGEERKVLATGKRINRSVYSKPFGTGGCFALSFTMASLSSMSSTLMSGWICRNLL